MNKGGGEHLLSIWWLLVLALVGLGIVFGVLLFAGRDIYVKDIEAELLADKIVRCLAPQGKMNFLILGDEFNLVNKCGLSNKIFKESNEFYVNVKIKNESFSKEIGVGNTAFKADCEIVLNAELRKKPEQYPACFERKEFAYYKEKNYEINVLVAVAQQGAVK